jgi:hypothetical protein
MDDMVKPRGRITRWAAAAGLLATGVVVGGVIFGTLSANAAGTTPTPSSSSGSTQGPGNYPAHGTAAHEAMEKPVTGSNATQAQAAAVKAVGGGQAGAVTTDVTGKGYEVTVTKSDGSQLEVHLDQSFNVEDHGHFGGRAGEVGP